MPLLVYSYPDFTPNTVIRSAQVNAKYNDIKTLLNVTKLDDSNIQDAGITRGTKLKLGTANHVLINSGTGAMSSEATLSPTRGGLGASLTLTVGDARKTLQVNAGGTGFELVQAAESAGTKLYNFSRFV
jgi:hypothetical protein